MRGRSGFAYAQTRMQARHGRRADDGVFRSLAGISDFRHYLGQARATALEPWVANISAACGSHELERLLRASLRARVTEVASWLPEPWRAAVCWTGVLYDLPALEHLLCDDAPLPWMFDDGELESLATAEPAMRRAVLERSVYAPLVSGGGAHSLLECWLAEWRRLFPPTALRKTRRLERLVALVHAHRAGLVPVPTHEPVAARMAWEARRELEAQVAHYFRRTFLEPAAVFAHLLLLALEFERLRGALLSRRLYSTEDG